jgi:hypothetical protein
MEDNANSKEKSIAVEHLNFGSKTSQRVTWEAWSFKIVAPYTVEVTNESYGYLKDEHRYVVVIEDREGIVVPDTCECKADQYNEQYDCKHKVSLATIGGEVVLDAAVAFPPKTSESDTNTKPVTAADTLKADGGTPENETCPNGDPKCDGPESDDLPCFGCYEVF